MDPLEAQMSDLGDDLKEIGNRTRGIFPIGSSYYLLWFYNRGLWIQKILMKMWWLFNDSKSLLGIVLLLKKKNDVTQATHHSIKQINLLFLLVICFWLSLLHIQFLFASNNKNEEINYHILQINFKSLHGESSHLGILLSLGTWLSRTKLER